MLCANVLLDDKLFGLGLLHRRGLYVGGVLEVRALDRHAAEAAKGVDAQLRRRAVVAALLALVHV